MKIVVFSPHPDDDVLGCGGSIVKHIQAGNEVIVVYMTNGDAGDLNDSKEALSEIRKKEAQEAAKILGISKTIYMDLADGYVEYQSEILNKIIGLLREYQPEIVYIPHAKEAHRDHKNTFAIVNEAIIRASANSFQEAGGNPWYVPTILCYEVWTPLQEISYVENISDYMEIKIQALQKHRSQIKNLRYDNAIEGLNTYRGIMTGKGKYCECFQIVRVGRI